MTPRLPIPLLAAVAASLLASPAASAAAAGPDLIVRSLASPPRAVEEGGSFDVAHQTANRGTARAAATDTRFYLSVDPRASLKARRTSTADPRTADLDVLLGGAAPVKPLAPGGVGGPGKPRPRAFVPVGTAPGEYTLLACADDRAAARERNEGNNCRAAKGKLRVTSAAEPTIFQAFSDTFEQPPESVDRMLLDANRAACTATVKPKRFGLQGAMSSARGFLRKTAGADAMAAFGASPAAKDPVAAQSAAAQAVAVGQPGAALAALLRAHDLEPRNGSHLINAAAVAATVGLPNEALAMLDGSRRLELKRPAMGISQHATSLAIRGQALSMLGRQKDAERALAAAAAAEPLLAEAHAGLAFTTLCQSGPDAAIKIARKARKRNPAPPEQPLDESKGIPTKLRQLPLAGSPKEQVAMRELYQAMGQTQSAEIDDHNAREDALRARMREKEATQSRAERSRLSAIRSRAYAVVHEPQARANWQAVSARLDDLTLASGEFWGSGTGEVEYRYRVFSDAATALCRGTKEDPRQCWEREMHRTCRPALAGAHARYLDQMRALQTAADAHMDYMSRRISAVAANVSDPDAYADLMLQIEELESALYANVFGPAEAWSRNISLRPVCFETPEPPTQAAPGATQVGSPGGCAPGLASLDFVFVFGPTKLKVNCEKITQSFSHEVVPWIQAFAEVSFDRRSGTLTVLAGSKFEAKAPGAKLAFKSGVYLTADRSGSITDVGWRVGPSATVGTATKEFKAFKDEVDLSFVSGISAMVQ